jgi:hypothetical protein
MTRYRFRGVLGGGFAGGGGTGGRGMDGPVMTSKSKLGAGMLILLSG